jgi:hypothetical protein
VGSWKKNVLAPWSNFPIVDDGDHEENVVGVQEDHTSSFPIVDATLAHLAVADNSPNYRWFRSKVLVSGLQMLPFHKNLEYCFEQKVEGRNRYYQY